MPQSPALSDLRPSKPAGDLCLSDIVDGRTSIVSPACTLLEAAWRMERTGAPCLAAVGEDRRLVGLLDERDFLQLSLRGTPPATPVAEAVRAPTFFVPDSLGLRAALFLLRRLDLRYLATQNAAGEILGIVDAADLLARLEPDAFERGLKLDASIDPMPAELPADTPLEEALRRMAQENWDCVLATQGGKPIGTLAENDLPRVFRHACELPLMRLSDAARVPLRALSPEMPVGEAAALMARLKTRRSPVLDERGGLLGGIGLTRLLDRLDIGPTRCACAEFERRRQDGLTDAEDRLKLAMEAAGLGVWEYEHQADRIVWNAELCALLERSAPPANLQDWLAMIHPDDIPDILARIQAAQTPGDALYEAEYRLRRADGRYLWFHSRGRVMRRDAAGLPSLTIGTMADISERKEAELLLRIQHDFATLLTGNPDRETVLQGIFDSALAVPELDGGGLYWRQTDGSYLLAMHRGLSPRFVAAVGRLAADSPQAELVRRGKMQWSCLAPEDDENMIPELVKAPPVAEEGIQSLVVLPILVDGSPVACLNLAGKHCKRLGRRTVAALETLTRQFGQALQRLTAREEANYRQDNLDGLFAALNDFLFVLDAEGRILLCNPAVAERLGYGPDLLGRPILDLHPPEVRDMAGHILADMLAGNRLSCPLPLLKADGGQIRVDTRTVRGVWNGQPALFGLSRDITAEHRAQTALRESEARFRTLFETANDAILILRDGQFIDCNGKAETLFETSRQTLLGATPLQFSPEQQPNGEPSAEATRTWIAAAESGQPQSFEWRHVRADGTEFDAEISLNAFKLGEETLIQSILRDIGERKRAEAARQTLIERLSHIIEGTRAGTWEWNVQTGEVTFNERWAEMLGYTLAELAPTSIETWERLAHPDDLAISDRLIQEHFDGRMSYYECEARLRHKNGHWIWVLDRGKITHRTEEGKPLWMFGTHLDITERKRVEQLLDRQALRLRSLLKTASDGLHVLDREGRLHEASDSFLHMLGYDAGTLPRLHVSDWDARFSRQELADLLPQLMQGTTIFETRHRRRDGSLTDVEISATGVDLDGERFLFASARDIGERKRFERQLETERDRAESANRAKSDFLANMSHEIRTPMNAIVGLTGLALDTELTDRQRGYLEKVRSSSKALLRLLNDILDYSKIEAGCLEIERTPFDLADVLRNALDLFAPRMEEQGLAWSVELAPELPRYLIGDAFRLNQILINLIGNAVKFTERGEIGVRADLLDCDQTSLCLRIVVRDTGIGMTPEQIEHLFSEFTQADSSITRKYGGTGLGLSIVKRLVGLMDGEIWASGEPGRGSVFSFTARFLRIGETLPQTPPPPAPLPLRELARRAAPIRGAHVLVVDDDEANRALAQELMDGLGLRASCAANGQEALDLTRRESFAAVLMDLQMPEMDGIETTRRILANLGERSPPVLALTAAAMERHRQACLEAGMRERLTKPLLPETLLDALLRWIEPVRQTALRIPGAEELDRQEPPLDALERLLAGHKYAAKDAARTFAVSLGGTVLSETFVPVTEAADKLKFAQALKALQDFKERRASLRRDEIKEIA